MIIPGTCIEIETTKFPIADGEDDEVINERMYGKALCRYLQSELPKFGIESPMYCCEDWGWWIELTLNDFKLGLQIYSDPDFDQNPERYAIMSSISTPRKWSWRKLAMIDMTDQVSDVMDRIEALFKSDPEIGVVKRLDDFPF